MNNQIPPHKSERMFRRYEQAIFAIVQQFPNVISFDPKPLSIVTFSCRLRDAMSSLLEYKWASPIDVNRLAEIRPQVEVAQVNGMVVVRKVGTAMPNPLNAQGEVAVKDDFAFNITKDDPIAVFAAAYLIERQFLNRPVQLMNVSQETIAKTLENYDVGITATNVGTFVML